MHLHALWNNIQNARRTCPNIGDQAKRLAWVYARDQGPRALLPRTYTIRFRYSDTCGELTLRVRGNHGSDYFIFTEVFEHRYYDFDLPSEPETILDLGGNVGFTSIFFARKYPGVAIATVEPLPQNAALLRTNLALNGITASVFEAAVTVEDGSAWLQLEEHDYGHRLTLRGNGNGFEVKGISVPTLLATLRWERIGLLKVDIEGYESELLTRNSDWLDRVDALCVEWHHPQTRSVLDEVAARYGFQRPAELPGIILLRRETDASALTS